MNACDVDFILSNILDNHPSVSDINITVGKPFQVEVDGQLAPARLQHPIPVLTPYQTETFALQLLDNDRRAIRILLEEGATDISYTVEGRARFRVNIFSGRGTYAIVMRRLATRIPSLEDLNLPPVLSKLGMEKHGLVLVTGATGSGKSSTLAAVLRHVNQTRSVHVVTLEDPIEFVHTHNKATFNQRELGCDFDTFENGLRAALRQAPKIVLVGEMRDRATVEIALHAAETGHLVMSTLHTIDAGQTINRIVGMFEQAEEQLIRTRLASCLRWVVSQRLMPKIGGGRVAALEILCQSLRVKASIVQGESDGKTFYEIMEAGNAVGMQTFDSSILASYQCGLVSEETASAYASHRSVMRRGIDKIKSSRGQKTTDLEGLTMDNDYERRLTGVAG
ncbi:MAG: PilT/PilU family type 4a pilus ATPase [Proteobacteria bacterium]|nr:PilT/PilU family type 4a pilus ATPase [Pseudomonadota bacterium]